MADKRGRGVHGVWLGPLLTFVGMVSYFQYFVRYPALRDFPWVNLPIVLAGVALAAWGARRAFARPARRGLRLAGSAGLLLALVVGGFFGAYVFAISSMLPEPTSTLRERVEAPEFELADHEGRPVRLADLRGRKVVLVFYRGHW